MHGARGGPTQTYDIHIIFFREEQRLPIREIVNLKTREHKQIYKQDENDINTKDSKSTVVVDRIPEVSVTLSVRACEELISWLMKKVEEIKQRTEIIGEPESSDNTESGYIR